MSTTPDTSLFGELRALLHVPSPSPLTWRRLRARLQHAIASAARGELSEEAVTQALEYASQALQRSEPWERVERMNPVCWMQPEELHALTSRALTLCNALDLPPGALQRTGWRRHLRLEQVRALKVRLTREEDSEALVNLLQAMPSLESLSPGHVSALYDETFEQLFATNLPNLHTLRVISSHLSEDHIQHLLNAPFLPQLQELHLEDNVMDDDQLVLLCEGLPETCTLRRVEVSYNELSGRGLQAMVKAPAFAQLEHLVLTFNELQAHDLAPLYKAPLLNSLKTLAMDFNELDSDTLTKLCKLKLPALTSLDVGGFEHDPDVHLKPLLKASFLPALRALRVAGSELTTDETWAELFQRATQVTALDLMDCHPGEQGFEALLSRLRTGQVEELQLTTAQTPPAFLHALLTQCDLSRLGLLSLRSQPLDDATLHACTQPLPGLTTLHLSRSLVTSDGVAHLLSRVEPFTLHTLDLSRLELGGASTHLIEAISRQALSTLSMSAMRGGTGEDTLLRMIRACALTLEHLDVSQQPLSERFFEELARTPLLSLQRLNCEDTGATRQSLTTIARSTQLPNLQEIRWTGEPNLDPHDLLQEEEGIPAHLRVLTKR